VSAVASDRTPSNHTRRASKSGPCRECKAAFGKIGLRNGSSGERLGATSFIDDLVYNSSSCAVFQQATYEIASKIANGTDGQDAAIGCCVSPSRCYGQGLAHGHADVGIRTLFVFGHVQVRSSDRIAACAWQYCRIDPCCHVQLSFGGRWRYRTTSVAAFFLVKIRGNLRRL